jgi:hypothetical protein
MFILSALYFIKIGSVSGTAREMRRKTDSVPHSISMDCKTASGIRQEDKIKKGQLKI